MILPYLKCKNIHLKHNKGHNYLSWWKLNVEMSVSVEYCQKVIYNIVMICKGEFDAAN